MAKRRASINLLQNNRKAFYENFLDWALSIGRLIVILTEVIALGAFLWRFHLDSNLADLHTKIKQQQVYIAFFKQDEAKYRNLQERLSTAKNLADEQNNTLTSFFTISSLITPGIVLNAISLTDKTVHLDITIADVSQLTSFISQLRQSPFVGGISIDKIQNKAATNVILATITVTRAR